MWVWMLLSAAALLRTPTIDLDGNRAVLIAFRFMRNRKRCVCAKSSARLRGAANRS